MHGQVGTNKEVLLNQILDRAATDAMFRGKLIEDPRNIIFDEYGVSIPDAYRIRFIERDPELDALVVLPDFAGNGELSDDDLEYVCGGTDNGTPDW